MSRPPPAYSHYQHSGLGISLRQALQEMVDQEELSEEHAAKILRQFDTSINDALKSGVRSRASFNGALHTYRNCDNVWTFFLENVTFKSNDDVIPMDKILRQFDTSINDALKSGVRSRASFNVSLLWGLFCRLACFVC
eukprot:TRINITY_DN11415_c0_g1_i1.p1 TRINITY_DN11415_c0_g1~~TRINITY_DN11415_c0_g1_i1.p1  ORF type:complete len:138 (+),score=24.29 TRINITY_DN11415_c0_g1_i1:212-625(+)